MPVNKKDAVVQRSLTSKFLKLVEKFSSTTRKEQGTQLSIETLEPRMMLSGVNETLIFEAGFEDVDVSPGRFVHVAETSGFTATGSPVEIQHNPRSVGPASEGNQHLELDRDNGIFVDLTPGNSEDLILRFDYSGRPRVSAEQNTIEVYWQGNLVETLSDDGSSLRTTDFRTVETVLSGTSSTGRLEFRSTSPQDSQGRGGLLDDILVFQMDGPVELAEIPDQEVELTDDFSVTATLLSPNEGLDGAVFSILNGPVGLEIDSETGVITWPASEANVDASNLQNDSTVLGDPQLVFQAGFEDVDVPTGGFAAFDTVSGFTSTGRPVEIQDNHRSVGAASEGEQILELDRNNGVFRNVETASGDQFELVLDYSPRPGIDAENNAIDILWDGEVIDTITVDGRGQNGTAFEEFRFDLSEFSGDLTRLELRSTTPGDRVSFGGLIDNVRLFRRSVETVDGVDGKFDVTVQVVGPDGQIDTEEFTICVLPHAPTGPVIDPIATQAIDEGQQLSVTATATGDGLSDQLTFSIVDGPGGLTIDDSTGEITFTPTEAQGPSVFTVVVGVSNADGLTDQTSFDINVGEVNLAPVLAPIAEQMITAGESVTFTATATDSDLPANSLTFSLDQSAPSEATIDAVTGEFSLATDPADTDATFEFDVIVTDEAGLTDSQTVAIVVTAIVINGPVLDPIATQTIDEGQQLSVTATANDADLPDDELVFSIVDGPDGLTIDATTGEITFTPTEAQGPGLFSVTVAVSDLDGNTSQTSFEINVGEVNTAPVLAAIEDQTIDENGTLSVTASATDGDVPVQAITYSFETAPAGATIDASTGEISWTTTESDGPGTFDFTVVATDNAGATDTESFQVTVVEVNTSPVLAPIADQTVSEGETLTFTATGGDSDLPANQLTFSLGAGAPVGATIDPATGEFSWTPSEADGPGVVSITVLLSDGEATDSQTFDVTINEVNVGPTLDPIADQTVNEGETLAFTATGSDSNVPANELTFSLGAGAPVGATIDPATGEFSWTSTEADGPGVVSITVLLSDGDLTDSETFDVTINEVNDAPTLDSIADQTVSEGETLALTATGSDSDLPANQLTFSLGADAPDGASIDPTTGEFSWTPTEADGPGVVSITVLLSDGDLTDSETFDVTINEVNVAPVLEAYSIQPILLGSTFAIDSSASDADSPANTLTFSFDEAPAGATIDPVSGAISWTPTEAGEFSFTVRVTDDGNLFDTQEFLLIVNSDNLIPTVTASLRRDTAPANGTNNDLITYDPTIIGSVNDANGLVETLEASLDGGLTFTDVSDTLGEAGEFELSHTLLDQIAGGELADGEVTLILVATDDNGGSSAPFEFTFVFDSIAPDVEFDLDESSDTGPLGDQETEIEFVSLIGQTDAGELAFFSQQADSVIADASGNFRFDDYGLEVGENETTITAVDIAGNENSQSIVIELVDPEADVNNDPEFVSRPPLEFQIPLASNDADGNVTPTLIDVELIEGLRETFTVSLTLPEDNTEIGFADILFVVDESGSMSTEHAWIPETIRLLDAALEAQGIGPNRFGLLGFTDRTRTLNPLVGTTFSLFDSDGNLVQEVEAGATVSPAEFVLPDDGDYTVVVSNSNDVIDRYDFDFDVAPVVLNPLSLDEVTTGQIVAPGQQEVFTFALEEETFAHFDVLTRDSQYAWTLEGPDGIVVDQRGFGVSDSTTQRDGVQVLAAGSYTLTIAGIEANTGNFSFALRDLASATPIESGVIVTGALNPANETDLYQFQANAGDSLFVDFVSVDSTTGGFRIIGPDGSEVSQGISLRDVELPPLTQSGTYTLLLEGVFSELAPNNYEIGVSVLTQTTSALTLNTNQSGSISLPGQQDIYAFSIDSETVVYFDSFTDLSGLTWSLTGPNGSIVNDLRLDLTDSLSATFDSALKLLPGDYQLTIDGTNDAAGDYGFRLVDFESATSIAPGTVVSGELTIPNETDLYSFDVNAGDNVYFDVVSASDPGGAFYRLFDANGNLLFTRNSLIDTESFLFEEGGTYTLLVIGDSNNVDSDTYEFNLVLNPIVSTAVSLGDTISGEIERPGEVDSYTFEVTSPTLFYLDNRTVTDAGFLTWSLSGPGGSLVDNLRLDRTDSVDGFSTQLLQPGTWTLEIDANSDLTTSYEVVLVDLNAAATNVDFGAEFGGTLATPTQTDVYSFSATAGDDISVEVINTTDLNGSIYSIVDAFGNAIFRSFQLRDVANVELQSTGTHFLLVEGERTNLGNDEYSLTIVFNGNTPVDLSGTALVLDAIDPAATVTGSIADTDVTDNYAFTLTEDSLVYFDSLTNSSSLTWTLRGPQGDVIVDRRFDRSDGNGFGVNNPAISLFAGEYQLSVASSVAADYSFRLLDLATAPAHTIGTPITGDLTLPNEADVFQTELTQGDVLFFDVTDSNDTNNTLVRLIDPNGNVEFQSFGLRDSGPFTVQSTGNYKILVEGFINNTGLDTYAFTFANAATITSALNLGERVDSSIALPGQTRNYEFSLATEAVIYFDSLTDEREIRWTLTGPAGVVVNGQEFSDSDSFDEPNPLFRIGSGDYVLTVDGTNDHVGDFGFRLSDVSTGIEVATGTPFTGELTTPSETDIYRFEATEGDVIYVDVVNTSDSFNTEFKIADDLGNVLAISNGLRDLESFVVPETGSYTLLVEGWRANVDADTYEINLVVAPQRTSELTLGSLIDEGFSALGQTDTYTFELTDPTTVIFDSRTNSTGVNWTLTGPDGEIVTNQQFSRADSLSGAPAYALAAGSYSIQIDGVGEFVDSYSFVLLNAAALPEVSIGGTIIGSFADPTETDAFGISLNEGQSVFFEVTAASDVNGGLFRLISPTGEIVATSNRLRDLEVTSLDQSGLYTLLIEGAIGNTGDDTYEIVVREQVIEVSDLAVGSIVNGAISTPAEQDIYNFSVTESGAFYFDSFTDTTQISWSLTGPDGSIISNRSFRASDSIGQSRPLINLGLGDYTITVESVTNATGDYAFRLVSLSDDVTPYTPGDLIEGSYTNESSFFEFGAEAGDQLFFDVEAVDDVNSAAFRLFDQSGVVVFTSRGFRDVDTITVQNTGDYVLAVEGAVSNEVPTNFALRVVEVDAPTPQSLVLNTTVTGEITSVGAFDTYEFSIADDGAFYFDSLSNDATTTWTLTGPFGDVVTNRRFDQSDSLGLGTPELYLLAGDYTLTIDRLTDSTGDYGFRLLDLSTAPLVSYGDVITGDLTPSNETDAYSLDVSAGDEVSVTVNSTSDINGALYRLLDPFGQEIFQSNLLRDVATVSLNVTGRYTLLVEGTVNNVDADTYSLTLNLEGNTPPPTATGTALQFNTVTSGNIATSGDTENFLFTVSESDVYYFDSLTNSGSLTWTLTGPTGTAVNARRFNASDSFSFTSPAFRLLPGEYQLSVTSTGFTGDFDFNLRTLASGEVLTPGTSVAGDLATATETDIYRFDVEAGERFFFDVVDASDVGSALFRVVDGNGQTIFTSAGLRDVDTFEFELGGEYFLLVEGWIANTGLDTYEINISPVVDSLTEVELGSQINGSISSAGESDQFTFNGSIGDRIYLDINTVVDFDLVATITNPDGTLAFDGNSPVDNDSGVIVLGQNGQYTINISGAGDNVGDYGFRLNDVSNAVILADGNNFAGEYVVDREAGVFQVSGQAGERIVFATPNLGFANEIAFAASFLTTGGGGTEDGYFGINEALQTYEFRDGAARNIVLISDEDRDVFDQSLDFENVAASLESQRVLLNTVNDARFEDGDGATAVGVDSVGNAYVADGTGSFIVASGGEFISGVGATEEDYVDLAALLGGASWDLNQLRDGGDNAASFTQAFVDISTDAIARQLQINLQTSDSTVGFENLTGIVDGVAPGETAMFDFSITQDGLARAFDVQFVREGTGNLLGSIPVRIAGPFLYEASAIDVDGDDITYSIVAGPDGAVIDPVSGLIYWRPTEPGEFDFEILAEDGNGGSDTQAFTLNVTAGGDNTAPFITSSPQEVGLFGEDFQYQVIASDVDNDAVAYLLVDGPAGATIDQASGLLTWSSADILAPGDFDITVRAQDAFGGFDLQSFTLSINAAPEIVSIPRTTGAVGAAYDYQILVEDLDDNVVEFDLERGPDGLTISADGLLTWAPGIEDLGSHEVSVRVTDANGLTATQSFTLVIEVDVDAPVVELLATPNPAALGDEVAIQVTATDNGEVADIQLRVGGAEVVLDANGIGRITPPSPGLLDVVATAVDTLGNATVETTQLRVVDTSDVTAPFVEILSPTQGTEVTFLADIIGTVEADDLAFYRVEYARADLIQLDAFADDNPAWQVIAEGTGEITNDVLATLDTTLLQNDTYAIRLYAEDFNGNINTAGTLVDVNGTAKIGNLIYSYVDLSVDLPGVPIRIERIYESIGADEQQDFGHGWRLRFYDPDIRESVPDNGGDFFTQNSFTIGTRVYVTTPEGERVGFTFDPILNPGLIFTTWTPRFVADPGVNFELRDADISGNALVQQADGGFGAFAGLGNYNPSNYILTAVDGTEYAYNEDDGIQSVTDLSGNQLTFDENGISSNFGTQIEFVRDSEGRISEIIDPDGNSIRYVYDANGDLINVINQEDEIIRYEYSDDREHFLSEAFDNDGGLLFEAIYDEDGRLISQVDSTGAGALQSYDLDTFTGTFTDARGNVSEFVYDDRGNIIQITDPLTGVFTYEYDDPANPDRETRIQDSEGNVTEYAYDADGNITQISRIGDIDNLLETPETLLVTYNDLGDVLTFTDERGNTTTNEYDEFGNRIRQVDANLNESLFDYDENGRVTRFVDFDGAETLFEYDGLGDPTRITYADASFELFAYDQWGLLTSREVFEADSTLVARQSYGYDRTRQLTSVLTDDLLIRYEWQGKQVVAESFVDQDDPTNTSTTRFVYNDRDELIEEIDDLGNSVRYTYDASGNRTSVTDPLNNVTSYIYDDLGRVVEVRDPFYNPATPEDHVTRYQYDSLGNITQSIDRNGLRTEFEYDHRNNLTLEQWFEGTTLVAEDTYTYNAVGNLAEVVGENATYTYQYDSLNRLSEVVSVSAFSPTTTISYVYDELGRITNRSDNLGVGIASSYDLRGRLTDLAWTGDSITDVSTSFSYNALGSLTEVSRFLASDPGSSTTTSEYVYDLAGRLTNVTHSDGGGALTAGYEYTFDFRSLVTNEVRTHADASFNETLEFTFDGRGQLTATNSTLRSNEFYTYDANGNRLSSHLNASYTIGTNNQLLSDGDFTYAYDDEGNQISQTSIATGEVTTYEYNHNNQLVRSTTTDIDGDVLTESVYAYDTFGRRVAEIVDGELTGFVYDGENVWADFNSSGEVTARYLFGEDSDQILARQIDGTVAWYLEDGIGSIRDIVDQNGEVINHTNYDSFGQILSETSPENGDRYKFTGRELIGALYYYRARTYDPAAGRFTSQDPIGFDAGDANLYRYVGNSPLNFTDPSGEAALLEYVDFACTVVGAVGTARGPAEFVFDTLTYLALVLEVANGGGDVSSLPPFTSNPPTPSWRDLIPCGIGSFIP